VNVGAMAHWGAVVANKNKKYVLLIFVNLRWMERNVSNVHHHDSHQNVMKHDEITLWPVLSRKITFVHEINLQF